MDRKHIEMSWVQRGFSCSHLQPPPHIMRSSLVQLLEFKNIGMYQGVVRWTYSDADVLGGKQNYDGQDRL
jgi:hypothetical protein